MKNVDLIKFILGSVLASFAILGELVFFLGYFIIWLRSGSSDFGSYSPFANVWGATSADGNISTSTAPIFLGICAIAGAYLLVHTKSKAD